MNTVEDRLRAALAAKSDAVSLVDYLSSCRSRGAAGVPARTIMPGSVGMP